ncbi:uncharacterized protein A4U43_C01F8000 [Asparagus officinalis]|uniref:Pentatricopeptide repeat-containing protein n=1 Tax=Asparagus officinalis TaxID=4686 RepID=A0A5P1FMZ2_ASPOF|nr:pentatricopeptide repeat-containing protein At4g21065-like [Asparagus officinalis]XP_020276989.1 pentatricopeptide repeat-containing protein At4g21065-like [Asparagus officinalis]XP_020276993.1 pentatricopeptide repeat-containing protein At4g21065-like [Asparagus officinalis]ONK79598.1 uncharacterized protein A4U43_C01F8000 [Asparagus officinalis]
MIRKPWNLSSSISSSPHFSSQAQSPSWVSTNQIFRKHPRLQLLHKRSPHRCFKPIFSYSLVSGLFQNPFVSSQILQSSTLFLPPDPSFSSLIFTQMKNPNAFSFNTMIKSNPSSALKLYVEMLERRIFPDKHTFPFLIKSLNSVTPNLNIGKLVHAHVFIFGFGADPFVQTSLLSMYFACQAFDDALRLFNEIPKRDVTTWTAVISGLVAQNCHLKALDVFKNMRVQAGDSSVRPNVATMVSVLSACAGLGSLDIAESLHAYIEKVGLHHDLFIRNSLIDSYPKCGSITSAWQVFHCTVNKDLHSWTAMITGLASHGLGNDALDLFSRMQKRLIVPDSTTFIAVLTACSHSGLVDEGIQIFESMEAFNLKPEIKHYGCMVDLFSRAGLLARAYGLVSDMPMEPNLVILGALLSACRVHGDLDLAKLVMEKIESSCSYHGGARVLLSNMFADKNQWNDVVSVRESTRKDESKPQGKSWIEVMGVVHEFGVEGSSYHALAREMHLVLDELGKLMEGSIVDVAMPF